MILECPHCHSRYDLSGRAAGTLVRCPCGASFPVPKLDSRAGQIRCPSCDASCSPTDSSCSYCNARLAMAACPACLGRIFAENRFCPHCGAKVNVGAKPAPDLNQTKNCPRCQTSTALQAHLVDKILLHECPTCGGVWLENHSFDRLLSERESSSFEQKSCQTIPNSSARPAASATPSRLYIPCPDCSKLMNLQNFARSSGIIVDVCKTHGIWFDPGELSAIVRFVKNGGMEKARRKELEQAQRELEIKMAHPRSAGEENLWLQEGSSSSLLGRALQIMIKVFIP